MSIFPYGPQAAGALGLALGLALVGAVEGCPDLRAAPGDPPAAAVVLLEETASEPETAW